MPNGDSVPFIQIIEYKTSEINELTAALDSGRILALRAFPENDFRMDPRR